MTTTTSHPDAAGRRLVPSCAEPRIARVVAAAVLAGVSAAAAAAEPKAPSRDGESLFESHVRPLLVERCQRCHGDAVAEAGLRLDSRRAVLAGGDSGPAAVPGKPGNSPLLAAVRHAGDIEMPPDGKLSADEIALLETWVSGGLPWSGPGSESAPAPDDDPPHDIARRAAEARTSHWAFRPPARHPAPDLPSNLDDAIRAAWSRSPIDRFVAARMTAEGVAPSPDATPRDLVRRLWFDLTGLPPPAAEVDRFCAKAAEDGSVDVVFAATVERLLATPEHAEHWARKWLDIARYSDTIGYALGVDNRHPFAWVYRDWVVDALAADMPYDRFVTLQLAADLVAPPVERRDLAALGFLTVGRTFRGNEHDIIDDRIDLVTRGLMGMTAACARCHDHKYEPIGTADYYALHGIFASCRTPEELPLVAEAPPGPEADAFKAKLQTLRDAVARHAETVHARATRDAIAHAADYFMETARPAARAAVTQPPRLADGYVLEQLLLDRLGRLVERLAREHPDHPVLGPWLAARGAGDEEVAMRIERSLAAGGGTTVNTLVRSEIVSANPATLRQVAEAYARVLARAAPAWAGGPAANADDPPDLMAVRDVLGSEGSPLIVPAGEAMRVANRPENEERTKLRRAVTSHFIESPGGPRLAPAVRDHEPKDSPVLIRGNPARPGPTIERRLPLLLGGGPVAREASGRLELAQAIVAIDNPLTPRVVVNWAWAHHVGRGLVTTPDDMGLRGTAPSHPELLDDLARRFVDEGRWSLRWLHREIVTSRTWRQSSRVRDDLAAIDPDNRLLARASRRRLDWEPWRDSLLSAAGTLDLSRRGGPGVDPLAMDTLDRRSLYAWVDRQDVPGVLRAFDVANPDTAVLERTRTTTPQQSLAVLNAPLVIEAARRVAARVESGAGDDGQRVEALWRTVLSRNPSADEKRLALEWLAAEPPAPRLPPAGGAEQGAARPRYGRWERMAQAVLATAEFQFID